MSTRWSKVDIGKKVVHCERGRRSQRTELLFDVERWKGGGRDEERKGGEEGRELGEQEVEVCLI